MYVFEVAKDANGPREPEDHRDAAEDAPGRIREGLYPEVAPRLLEKTRDEDEPRPCPTYAANAATPGGDEYVSE